MSAIRFFGDRSVYGQACGVNPPRGRMGMDTAEGVMGKADVRYLVASMGRELWDKIKKQYGLKRFLGAGSFAVAFLGKRNRVYKFTQDSDDAFAAESRRALGSSVDDILAKVYSVKKLKWMSSVGDVDQDDRYLIESEALYYFPGWFSDYRVKAEKMERLRLVSNMMGTDLVNDAHEGNWGCRRDGKIKTAVLLDFGCSWAPRPDSPIDVQQLNPAELGGQIRPSVGWNPSPTRDRYMRRLAELQWDRFVRWYESNVKVGLLQDVDYSKLVTVGLSKRGATAVGVYLDRIDPEAPNVILVLAPGSIGGNAQGECGWTRDGKYLVVSLFGALGKTAKATLKNLRSDQWRSVFTHEFVHVLDELRSGRKVIGQVAQRVKRAVSRGETDHGPAYFRSPAEWNAYYQQGFAAFERSGDTASVQDLFKLTGGFVLPPNTDHLNMSERMLLARMEQKLDRYWHPGFVGWTLSDPAMRKRFLKRLAVDVQALRDRP